MSFKEKSGFFIGIFLIVFLLESMPAQAYIDPGTGSYMLQVAIAFLVGALLSVKVFWKRIVSFLRGSYSKKNKDDTNSL